MHITVTFRHMEPSDALRTYAIEKIERVRKCLIEPIEVHWVLSVEKSRHIAGVTINANGITIKGEDETQDLYSSIDKVMDKIEVQVKRYKERIKDHKPGLLSLGARLNILSAEGLGEGSEPRVIRTENFFIKPMTLEDAIMQMDLIGHDFLVFTNSTSSSINVLYRRKDGNYGLIETGRV